MRPFAHVPHFVASPAGLPTRLCETTRKQADCGLRGGLRIAADCGSNGLCADCGFHFGCVVI
eukprot:4845739-Alexandrium_andersonii.AAC.1